MVTYCHNRFPNMNGSLIIHVRKINTKLQKDNRTKGDTMTTSKEIGWNF